MIADRLYFAQHGIAVNKTDDPERPLSKDGINQTRAVAKQLHALEMPVSNIFHSDKLRARQTAEIFSSVLNVTKTSEIKNLSPNDDISLIKPDLSISNALYIGHLPHMEKLVSSLVTSDENASIIKFQNSAVICLGKNDGLYQILSYITPSLTHR